MKRLISAAAIGIAFTALSAPAFAAGTPQYGSVKLNWSVNTQASMQIVTQYSNHAFTQGSAAIALQPSSAGVCGNSAAETAFNLSYGALNPSLTLPVGCSYPNAVAISVTTNDSNGFAVTQVVDSTASVASYVGFCSFPNTGAAPVAIGALNASARVAPAAGTFAANMLTGCAGGGTALPYGTAGNENGGGAGSPGNANWVSNNATEWNTSAGAAWVSQGTSATTAVYAGEDVQLNLDAGAPSAAATSAYITLILTPQ